MPSFDCYFCKSKIDCLYDTISCFNCPCFNAQFFNCLDSKIISVIFFHDPYSVRISFNTNESSIYYKTYNGIKKIYHINSIMNITPSNIKLKLPTILTLI